MTTFIQLQHLLFLPELKFVMKTLMQFDLFFYIASADGSNIIAHNMTYTVSNEYKLKPFDKPQMAFFPGRRSRHEKPPINSNNFLKLM